MTLHTASLALATLLVLSGVAPAADAPAVVAESARQIPVAYDVDVVVVGGSTGAVSAAVAAAQAGAKVFLAAPRAYLGEDVCSTLRLWIEEGEQPTSPLAQKIFAPQGDAAPGAGVSADQIPFTYETSPASAAKHKDTNPPSLLSDDKWSKPETESVQYDGDVTITCDLGSVTDVKEATILPYIREGADFNAASVLISTSNDMSTWNDIATVACDRPLGAVAVASAPINDSVRYVRFAVKRAAGATRLLIGEIRIVAPAPAGAKPAASEPWSRIVKPMHVKRTLDQALLEAKVDFLYGCYATDLLRDGDGALCGIVMANRAGRQAVLAKVIIDATDRAWVARMAGATFRPYPAGPQEFKRVVIGGEPAGAGGMPTPPLRGHASGAGENMPSEQRAGHATPGSKGGVEVRKVGLSFPGAGARHEIYEYTLRLPMADGSWRLMAAANQAARDKTFHLGQVDAAETVFQVPPDSIKGEPGGADCGVYRPAGVPRLYVLGGCADVPRDAAAMLLRPVLLIDVGAKVGAAAAAEAKALPAIANAKVDKGVAGAKPAATGDTKELLSGLRPVGKPDRFVASPDRQVPVIATVDVVVIGGGTGGAPAGIGAGREGAKTLLVEYLYDLGGVATAGRIIKYYHGNRIGFTAEVDKGIKEMGAANEVVAKAEWWRAANRKASTEIWLGAMGVGAFVEGGMVKGAVVATPEGRGVVLAKTVIDSTGNADIAAAAGAQTDYTGADEPAVQGAGLPPLNLGAAYTNTDYTFADDTDVVDFWQLFVYAREKFKTAYDLGQLVDTRERRRIVGDITITPMDLILGRTWPDSVVYAKSNFDSHGFTVHPIFFAMPPGHEDYSAFVPLRAMLPKGFDGIVVTGLGVSAQRDAMPLIRMQPDVQNQGYAMGIAAAMVARSSATIRNFDQKGLQKQLVQIGCLPEQVLTDKDSLPMPREKIAEAVAALGQAAAETKAGSSKEELARRMALAVVFAQPETALPLLEKAYAAASDADAKLTYANVLALFGSKAGADTLLEKVKATTEFDKGWNYTGMGQFGRSVSALDQYMIALARTRDPRALEVILEKVAMLDATKEYSHHRACAVALETLGDPRAAKPLADLLAKPGMTGYATTTVGEAGRIAGAGGGTETKPRNDSLRELVLARALYRCGDSGGIGRKILEQYAKDLRGHYARHAQAVLEGKKSN
jgi:ribulose 1,5-bisphosphate synthetase/thiazole synthase